jgi:fructose-bisphosphate aldolase, class I
MSGVGKTIRLNRFFARGRRAGVIVPIDHGLTQGPIAGLENTDAIGTWIQSAGITGIIAHKGMVERLGRRNLLGGLGVMVHLNGMSNLASEPHRKEMLTEIGSALRLGADGVSVQVNFDGQNDAHNLRLLGGVVDEAAKLSVPVLAMVYDVAPDVAPEQRLDRIRHLTRISIELGVDAIKLRAPDSPRQVRSILEHASTDAAIFFAGGETVSDDALLALLSEALRFGGAGLCAGRNVFQREPRERELLLGKLQRIVDPAVPARAADTSTVIELSEFAEGWVRLARPS